MAEAKKRVGKTARVSFPDELRLINILAELCQCDPACVEWDGEGAADTVGFSSDGKRYLLKLSKESVQGQCASVMDFRVRVITM